MTKDYKKSEVMSLITKQLTLDVKKYIPGKCFVCGEDCLSGCYAHSKCCIAYADDKEQKAKEYFKKIEEMQDKRLKNAMQI